MANSRQISSTRRLVAMAKAPTLNASIRVMRTTKSSSSLVLPPMACPHFHTRWVMRAYQRRADTADQL
jgi:hypothetical protein